MQKPRILVDDTNHTVGPIKGKLSGTMVPFLSPLRQSRSSRPSWQQHQLNTTKVFCGDFSPNYKNMILEWTNNTREKIYIAIMVGRKLLITG